MLDGEVSVQILHCVNYCAALIDYDDLKEMACHR